MASERERRMTGDPIVSLQRLNGCYASPGWWRREPLLLVRLASGKRQLAYAVYASRGGSPVYVTVAEL